jgi:23S rRNA (cytidine1920-2'-O)/16S rRNA (cytidine1409-2'-O)-methyltransferase
MSKERLDVLLARRGLVESRGKAQVLIRAGAVRVGDQRIDRPDARFEPDVPVEIEASPRFVSRGGDKLEAAFGGFQLDVSGLVCLDVGASTGGFTDCLLQRGAARVVALDVGYGQLHPSSAPMRA